MFKFLKDKIKNWTSKFSETAEEEPKKEIKKSTKKSKQEKKNKKETSKKKHSGIQKNKQESIASSPKKIPSKARQTSGGGMGDKTTKTLEEEPEKTPEESKEEPEKEKEKTSFFSKFKTKLTEEKFEEIFSELEMALLQNNVAYSVVEKIKSDLENELVGKNLSGIKVEEKLKQSLEKLLINPPNIIEEIRESLKIKSPYVICFVGINGSGKTTSIAKVAHLLKKNKLKVCLAAGDTFRAAAIQQLEQHAEKLEVPIIKKDYGADPAAVGFDAITYAKKNKIDVVLIDTAGRMNTANSLMREMEKITRVTKPDLKLFIGESITGNDATTQADAFNKSINIDGIILSKADVDEKGGTAISVSHVTQKPIFFLGVGQGYEDLQEFNKEDLLNKIFE